MSRVLKVGQVWWNGELRLYAVVYRLIFAAKGWGDLPEGAKVAMYGTDLGHGRRGKVWSRGHWRGKAPVGWVLQKDLES